jgi:Flp pilus assembly protein TadD
VIAGVILAAVLSNGSPSKPTAATTSSAKTVAPTTTGAASTPTTVAAPISTPSGHALNDKGYALMQRGDFAGALPYLQQAVQKLQGTGPGDPYEAYANYNLGFTMLQLGQCDAAVAYLQRADQLEPHNQQVQNALQSAGQCGTPAQGKQHGKHGKKPKD